MIPEKELLQRLRLNKVTLWKWRKLGCPFLRPGGRKIFYNVDAVMQWAEEQTRKELEQAFKK